MAANAKNITSKNGIVAKVGDTIRVVILDAHQQQQPATAILLAVNAEQEKSNGRFVLEKNIHALPVCDINEIHVLNQSEQNPVEFVPFKNEQGLLLGGPTIEVFVEAGFSPFAYPPPGYAEVLNSEEQEASRLAVKAIREKKFGVNPKDQAPANPVGSSSGEVVAPVVAQAPAETPQEQVAKTEGSE